VFNVNITLIGIDLAKNVFQICGVNQAGKAMFNKQVRRQKVLETILRYPDAVIAMEACSGSNYWGRLFQAHGFEAKLIPPQHVKPFVKGNKNDRNDAFAITEAAMRPNMIFVSPRSIAQTDLIQVHRVRERHVKARTALINQIRGFLNEFGIVFAAGKEKLQLALPELLVKEESELTPTANDLLTQLMQEWRRIDDTIKTLEKTIVVQGKTSLDAARLQEVKGIGKMTSTAVVAFAGNAKQYKNARHFAACLGLVPKGHSSGGKQKHIGVTKRGNVYVRKLLIQGAWSIVRNVEGSNDRLSIWAKQLIIRRGKQIAAVALANKLARIIWALLTQEAVYNDAHVTQIETTPA
jgi:transposase